MTGSDLTGGTETGRESSGISELELVWQTVSCMIDVLCEIMIS